MVSPTRYDLMKILSRPLVLLCVLTTLGIGFMAHRRHQSSPVIFTPANLGDSNAKHLTIKGLTGTYHHGEHAVRKFSIGALTIGPKKLSVFTVGRFSKLTIDRLGLELLGPFTEEDLPDLLDVLDLAGGSSGEKRKTKTPYAIIEADINGFDLKISESGATMYAVTAAKAMFKPQDSVVKLQDVVIHDSRTNETIHCKTALLTKDGRLTISGDYRLSSPSGVQIQNGWEKQILKIG